ncbi:hypothetical protein KTS45_10365 [Halomicroarcula limicola]|uniref:Uncharacterized protein n=1 Tax=Haloarcula limicola TaxID=1429915 RepID=A0A8J7Y9M0_9EURY|nr:hypothetical protein [Halomicroarcula limicola]MBV0924601.1 hypothetical protein [Halomicroarcula limicola]
MRAKTNRAVSDLVAFTLVFSVIISMIGLMTVGGVGALDDVREGTETNVAEATMLGYAETLADQRASDAPRRSTTIKLQGHGLERATSAISVTVDNGSGTPVDGKSLSTSAFVRSTDTGTELVYSNGALFRVEEGGFVVVRLPPIRCDANSAHLPLTAVRGSVNVSAENRVTLRSEVADRSLVYPVDASDASADSVEVDVRNTAYPEAWERVFEERLPNWTGSNGVYSCDTDRAVVHRTAIDITVVN